MPTVVIAPDGFGGTLSAPQAAEAIAAGWRTVRPSDDLILVPMSDGGEGLLDAVERPGDTRHTTEVAGPLGHPVNAAMLVRRDGSVLIESALACGLALVPPERRDPALTTTYGVGQLLEAARDLGARRILVGLGGSATVDGGAGALIALGFRPTVEDGSGLKIGAADLDRVTALSADRRADWSDVEVELLADVATPLTEAAQVFGPQKGASPEQVEQLRHALGRWADVVERDLAPGDLAPGGAPPGPLRELPATGAAGGLGYALVAALDARFRRGSQAVGELVGLPAAIAAADLVVTGEGRLDATTSAGKVVTHVADSARARGVPVHAVVGQCGSGAPVLDDVQEASPMGPPVDPAAEVRAAAGRSASVWTP
jgi:glycerate 2-kinase